jgi:hypothetical protein
MTPLSREWQKWPIVWSNEKNEVDDIFGLAAGPDSRDEQHRLCNQLRNRAMP